MSKNPYDYENRGGVRAISWEVFHGLCKGLARAIAPYQPDVLLPIGRGGYYPGTLIAHQLQAEVYPIRLSRRVRDEVRRKRPRWLLEPPGEVRGRRVLIVDEICSTGETLRMARRKVERMGAGEVRTAVLYAHESGSRTPDYIGLITDDLVLNPWDREVWREGEFQFHPEYVEALRGLGMEAGPSLLIDAPETGIAKGGG